MKKQTVLLIGFCFLLGVTNFLGAQEGSTENSDWAFNATIIEACSCPMFCQCYFNTKPAAHHGQEGTEHFCEFNNAFKVNEGHYGNVKLDGAKFWLAGDTGSDFTAEYLNWAVLTFDSSVTPEQRTALQGIMAKLYPVKYESFTIADDAQMEWEVSKDKAKATLDKGKVAEVILNRNPGMSDEPVVIQNLRYWGAPRHDGFVLMPNEVEAYRAGDKAFEYKGTNGFMITVDMNSDDFQLTKK